MNHLLTQLLSCVHYAKDGGNGTSGPSRDGEKSGASGKTFKKKKKKQGKHQGAGSNPQASSADPTPAPAPGTGFNKNALEWHNKDQDLFARATHISKFKLAGKQVTPSSFAEAITVGNRLNVFEMAITPGTVLGTEDPFNKAAIELFNKVRGKYTSTIPFQASDLAMAILAVANVISLISCTDRVLDMLGFVSFKTTLTPEIFHAALVGDVNNATIKAGYDLDVYESPNIKLALEVQVRRLQGLFMPKMSLFDFAGWIYRHVYFEDETGLRGDISLFRPSYIAKWSSTVPVHGATGVYASGLEYKDINSYLVSPNPHSAQVFLNAVKDCIDALVQDDNIRTICGWLHQYIPDSPTIAEIVMSGRETMPDTSSEMDLFISGLTIMSNSIFNSAYVQQDVSNECMYFTMVDSSPTSVVTKWMINYDAEPSDDEIGLSALFTVLPKNGYLYSDPFVCTAQRIYRRAYSGTLSVVTTERKINLNTAAPGTMLSIHEGKNPTTFLYTVDSGGAVSAASLYAECAYQVVITPENTFNIHYASISSLLMAEIRHADS